MDQRSGENDSIATAQRGRRTASGAPRRLKFRMHLHQRPRRLAPAAAMLLAASLTVFLPTTASAATASVSAVGSLITHTNQPSLATESVTVSPAASGDLLAVAVETKFPGTPSFTASTISGGGVGTWTRAYGFLTLDGFHGQELWWGKVTSTGASTLTVSYTSGSTAGNSESASSVDVQEFRSSAGASTVWSVDKTGKDDSGVASTTLKYPTLSPSSPPETYFGYLAVPGAIDSGTTSGVTYQTDARYNQVAYATSVSGTITPTATSSSQTYSSIGMLLSASTAADATAPSVPTGLAVSGTPTASSVSLTWSASTDNSGGSGVAGYRIFRNGSTTPLNTTLATTTSYTDTTVAASSTYSYTVAAVDRAGNQSAVSSAVSATTPAAGGGGGGGGGGGTSISNGGFESGSLSGWTASGAITGVTPVAHSGSYSALLGSANASNGDSSIAQTFTAPSGSPSLSFYWQATCPDTVQFDWSTATLKDNTTGTTTTPLAKICTTTSTWTQVTATLVAGHSYTLTLTNHDENYPGDATSTRFDDVTVR